jgi:feruloyl esterase
MRTRQLAPALPEIALAVAALTSDAVIAALPCGRLSELGLPDTTITLAQEVTTGTNPRCSATSIRSTDNHGSAAFLSGSRCYQPTRDSNIQFEIWLPLANWNGRFAGTSNGTTARSIFYAPMGLVEG